MEPIRLVLATTPRMLGDIVRETLSGHPDLEILAEISDPGELPSVVQRAGADVAVVVITPSDLRRVLDERLAERPPFGIVALTSDGRTAHVCQLLPLEAAITDVSPQSLIDAIRRVAAAGRR